MGGGELNRGERIADETDGSMVCRGGRCNISGGRGVSDDVAVLNGCFCKRLCYFLHCSSLHPKTKIIVRDILRGADKRLPERLVAFKLSFQSEFICTASESQRPLGIDLPAHFDLDLTCLLKSAYGIIV